jgi:alkaline phosphatase D
MLAFYGCGGAEPSAAQPAPPDAGLDMAQSADLDVEDQAPAAPLKLRLMTYNASLYGARPGAIVELLSDPEQDHPRRVAAIIQTLRPDVLLLNEFDYDEAGQAASLMRANFLGVGQQGRDPIEYPYVYVAPSNTGIHSGHDLDRNGQVVSEPGSQAYGNDAYGFGLFPGQYGFAIFSKYPIDEANIRTFQLMRWQALPDHLQPVDFYGEQAAAAMRLSSKNHVDVPINLGAKKLHVLASHPTPPAFDGAEGRNKRRNSDEIRLWTTYLSPASTLVDDSGAAGGLASDALFVVMGDLNSDPNDGDGVKDGIAGLLNHPRVQDPQPRSEGGPAAALRDGRANTNHTGDAALDTADFSDGAVGNLRVDYVLPSVGMQIQGAGVFWPLDGTPEATLTAVSDHHPVWVDVEVP